MDNLYEKLKAYETLLLQSIPHVDEEDQQAIHDALLLVFHDVLGNTSWV